MVIGIDNGNANTKTVNSVFTSGVTEHDVKPPAIADEILFFDGKYYTLSGNRAMYARDKTKNNTCFILTLFAIAKHILEMNQYAPVIDIDLGVGLPPEHYSRQREKFAEYFMKYGETVEFDYNDKHFIINIMSVNVFPQAFAAVAPKSSDLKLYSRTYIIDIGGYTTDVLLLAKGKPDLTYCRSLETGIITMNNKIQGKISTAYDMKIEEEHIYDVLFNKKTVLTEEIKNEIKKECSAHTAMILNQLRELGIDLRTNPAIFLGGGSLLLKEFIENSDMTSVVEFIPDISANAVGYTILTSAKLKKKSAANN